MNDIAHSVRIEPVDYHHEAAFCASNPQVPDFDAWFGFTPGADFPAFVQAMQEHALGRNLPPGRVPATFMLALVGDSVIGRVSIRHELNADLLAWGGNIGYCVVPAERRKGYATEMLRQALAYCRNTLGLDRALITCDETNFASRCVIERNGGILEDIRPIATGGPGRMRYWVTL